jgi:hypothetical protein
MSRIILCVLVLLSSSACALGVVEREALTPAPPTAAAPTAASPTAAAHTQAPTGVTQPAPTAPSVPTDTMQPAPTTPPEPTPDAGPTQIRFAPGATSATTESTLDTCHDIDRYRLQALEGQTMYVTVTSPDDEAIVAVTRQLPDGTWEPMVRSHFLESSVEVLLPATGSYDIAVMRKTAVASDCEGVEPTPVNYTLVVEIPPLSSGGLTLEMLKNAKYHLPEEGSFQLVDGTHYLTPAIPGELSEQWSVRLMEPMAFGDINGDGIEDAAVVIATRYGGTGIFEYLAVVLNAGGQAHNVDSVYLGDRTIINTISIELSRVHIDVVAHGPEDGLCCPSRPAVWTFELSDNELLPLPGDG